MTTLTTLQILERLKQGFRIHIEHDDFSNEYWLQGPLYNVGGQVQELCRAGWLTTSPNGGSYVLSDAGREAYARMIDPKTKHERRVVGHFSGWKQQMDTCVCGLKWPCPLLKGAP